MNRIVVLHLINGMFFGGGQRVVQDLLAVQTSQDVVQPLLCVLGTGSKIAADADFALSYNGKYNNPFVLRTAARELRKILRKTRVDVVHSHGIDADLVSGLAVRSGLATHVCHLHISPTVDRAESWKARVRKWLYRRLARKNRTWFLAVSEAVRRQMTEYYRLPLDRIVTVRNGINLGAFPAVSSERTVEGTRPVVLGTAARLAPMKGLEHLIDAAAELKAAGRACEVQIAGSGSLLDALRHQVERAGVAHEVRFLGHVEEMAAFYRGLDIFVLPSLSEGLPLTVLEAMACGVPVVASDVGGTAEALRDGLDGLVVPPGDVSSLTSALTRLIDSPELRRQMGQSGRDRVVSEFSRERVAREVYDVYCRMLAESRASVASP